MSYVEKIKEVSEQIKTHYARLSNFEEASAKNTWEAISDLFTEKFPHQKDEVGQWARISTREEAYAERAEEKEMREAEEVPESAPAPAKVEEKVNAEEQLDLVRQAEAEGRKPLDKVAYRINMDRINEGKSAIPITYYNQKAGKIRKAKLNNNEDFGKKFGRVYYYTQDELEEIRKEVSKYGESAHG